MRLGRALNFKGYFLSQSPLVSKVGLNNGDFDNAASVFLNRAIDKALLTELKDLYAPEKLSAIRNELDRRRAAGQDWLALVSDPLNDEVYLVEMPARGFYHARYLAENADSSFSAEGPNPTVPPKEGKTVEPLQANDGKPVGEATTLDTKGTLTTTSPQATAAPSQRCPKCSERTTKLKQSAPLKSGKFRFVCQNSKCDKKSFSALSE